jgi:hypothetical protein
MEITLYDQSGTPTAYLDDEDENTIWIWDGHAVAYLIETAIYGWNGEHIGWYISETIYDLQGHPTGYTSNTCPRNLKYEPYKRYKKYKRYKRYRRSLKSMTTIRLSKSDIGLEELFLLGSVQ